MYVAATARSHARGDPRAGAGAARRVSSRPPGLRTTCPRGARPEDRRWAERAEEIEVTRLAEFRRCAERWQSLVGVTFFFAAVANALAVMVISGPTSARFYNNSIQAQDLAVHDLLWSAKRLRRSQLCMAIAVVCVFVAAGVIWDQSR